MRKFAIISSFGVLLAALAATPAQAGTVVCPGSLDPTADRNFSLTTDPLDAVCRLWTDGANDLNGNAFDLFIGNGEGWNLIDKDNSSGIDDPNPVFESAFSLTGNGTTSGTFTLDAGLWSLFSRIAIGLKAGGGGLDPEGAVFELPFGETSGAWSITGSQTLSHGLLYGIRGDGELPRVPEPASLLLMGTGLLGLSRVRRFRRG